MISKRISFGVLGGEPWRVFSSVFRPREHLDRFSGGLVALQKSIHLWYPQKSTKMVSQSAWFRSWPPLVPKKIKMDPNMSPKCDIFGPQNGHNSTYRNTNYIIILLIFCFIWSSTKYNFIVFVSSHLSKMVFDFMLPWKWTKRALGDLKKPKKSRRRLSWSIWSPKFKSREAQHRPLERPTSAKKLQKGLKHSRVAAVPFYIRGVLRRLSILKWFKNET